MNLSNKRKVYFTPAQVVTDSETRHNFRVSKIYEKDSVEDAHFLTHEERKWDLWWKRINDFLFIFEI